MERQIVNQLDERDFVSSLIMSDKCCQVLVPYIKLNYFENDYTRIIVQWVIEYYHKFKSSPKNDILSLYRVHCDEIQDDSLRDLILAYLQKLADNDVPVNNEDFLLDKSRDFLDYRSLKMYTQDLDACLSTKSMDKARKIQSEYKKVSVAETNEVSLLSTDDVSIIQKSLDTVDEELVKLPEGLSGVFGKLHRNDFVSILAGMKKGKSWLMQLLALIAMKQQLNVVFVSMEMTREEVVQRMWKSLFGSKSGLIPDGIYETSRFVQCPDDPEKYNIELFDINVNNSKLNKKSVQDLQKELRAQNQYSGNLRIIAYPAFSVSVDDIFDRVEELAQDGFVADAVVIDYADITKPVGGGTELRNQLDATWKSCRARAMKNHWLVITASQTNRAGLGSSVVSAETIAEDIRKLAHVTSMVSMEQTPKMYKNHIMRLRNIAMRNGQSTGPCVFPQCLGLGQFMLGKAILAEQLNVEEDSGEE